MKDLHRFKVLKVGQRELYRQKPAMYLVSRALSAPPRLRDLIPFSLSPALLHSATTAAGLTSWWTSTSLKAALCS